MTTSTSMTAATPTDYAAKIRDKIKAALVDIIPDDEWNKMIEGETKKFLEATTERDNSYGSVGTRVVPSGLSVIVKNILAEETVRHTKELLASPAYSYVWDGQKQIVGEALSKIIRENSTAIIEGWLSGQVAMILNQMRR